MTINGRHVLVNFCFRPPRIIADRRRLGLPPTWPGKILGISGRRHRVEFVHHSLIRHRLGDELGRRYVHQNFELLVYYDVARHPVHVPLILEEC